MNAGHARPEITHAVARQLATLDYAPPFQMGHDLGFELAERLSGLMPAGLDHVFFANSGSESVDTALKIALAYHRARGHGSRTRLIGRERGYHGVGFGGVSVGGIAANRKAFGPLLPGVDHLRHTYDLDQQRFARGQPDWGAERAEDLERLINLHDPSTIAAVIVEPMAGSTGVLAAPKGYLERLRQITRKHDVLLIFDEVITAFGRLGAATAAELLGLSPDIVTVAKGLTNGAIPMGAAIVSADVHDAIVRAAPSGIELFHGYTYSAHPVACAAALATLDIYQHEALFERAAQLGDRWADAIHTIRGDKIKDVRTWGIVAGIELRSRPGPVGARGFDVFRKCFELGALVRVTGDIIALSPPLVISESEIDQLVETVRAAIEVCD